MNPKKQPSPDPVQKPQTLSELLEARKKERLAKKNTPSAEETEPLYKKKERSVHYCVKDGFFTAIKNGMTTSFIMPFAIALNASTGMLAALASVPQLVASFFQLFAQESLKFFKTRSRLIVITAILQSLIWLPLLIIPFVAPTWIWLILILVTLESTFGTFQGPIYNSILGDIIDEDKRGEFFGKRNRVVNLINFIATLIAGFILSFFTHLDTVGKHYYIFFGFAILFVIAFITRTIAAYYKSKIYDPPYTPPAHDTSFVAFMKNMTHDNYGIFVIYVFLLQFAVSISAPFFALYLLKDMNMGYRYFTAIMGISIAASFLTMGFWGRMIDKHGSKRVLTISGFLVPLPPLLMILAIYIKTPFMIFLYLFIEEAFSGVIWAGFNLSTSSFLFDATSKEERVKHIAYYNFLVGIAVFLGALLGGELIKVYPIWIISTIPFLFLTSGVLRFVATTVMIKKVREARMVEIHVPGQSFFHRVIAVPPHLGSRIEIIGTTRQNMPQKRNLPSPEIPKRKPIDPVRKDERRLYEKKSLDYYKENALRTMTQKNKSPILKDDSDLIEKNIEKDKKKISEIAEELKKQRSK